MSSQGLQQMRGSSLVESIVLLSVLVPMIFGVVMIGKLIDLKQTSEQAGRYAAWEATVYAASDANDQQPAAIRERFFGDPAPGLSSKPAEPGVNPLWGEPGTPADRSWSGRTAVTIDEDTVVSGYERDVGRPTVAMSVGKAAASAGKVLEGLAGNSWGLSANGLVKARVGVEVETNDWLVADGAGCSKGGNFACLQSSSVILVDGWSASSDDQAKSRVRSLVPASALQPLGDIVAKVGHIPMFKELKGLDGAFGYVNMNALPEYAK